ncbi:PREDICTED: CD83 antigen [Tinamus guttatus]|uniref:CD83 antigen n=1 Tax=Tinamus guttatus TaxID=94827 RepID=UPI00052EF1DD|nr:PREDICTED: CD83 antigen [Tinamus guttatus]
MSLIVSARLFILCNVWCLIRGASVAVPDVAVRCAEEVLLPCKVHQDSTVTYQTVSWYKVAEHGEGRVWKVLDLVSPSPQELGGSLELSNDTLFSLRIKNATSHNSGTYKCTLQEQSGERNLSGTVTLRVSGCPGILEDEKLKKYKTELFMLTCLGIFYLLLIFFTCTCLRKDSMSPNYHKNKKDVKQMLIISAREMTNLNSDSTYKNQLTSISV